MIFDHHYYINELFSDINGNNILVCVLERQKVQTEAQPEITVLYIIWEIMYLVLVLPRSMSNDILGRRGDENTPCD